MEPQRKPRRALLWVPQVRRVKERRAIQQQTTTTVVVKDSYITNHDHSSLPLRPPRSRKHARQE
jgi:hypothetical protein